MPRLTLCLLCPIPRLICGHFIQEAQWDPWGYLQFMYEQYCLNYIQVLGDYIRLVGPRAIQGQTRRSDRYQGKQKIQIIDWIVVYLLE
jgi:hypothetical protein